MFLVVFGSVCPSFGPRRDVREGLGVLGPANAGYVAIKVIRNVQKYRDAP